MFDVTNELWQPAAIQWNIESIVRSQAERQLAFRRAVVDDPTGSGLGNEENLSQICPNQDLLEQGWNVCWVLAMPRGVLYFYPLGTAILGEQDIHGGTIPPFALAHVLGHLMGLMDAPRCSPTFMRWFESAEVSSPCGNQTPTVWSDGQIKRARDQAFLGTPFRNPPVRRGRRR
jgi:hypothetical protein